MFKKRFISMLVLLLMTATGAWATITVTWNNNDITGSGNSFTKDGVTITAGEIEFSEKNFMGGGTFTTTLGNFTKIEVTTELWMASGTGWSGSTWTGTPASSVSFSGDIVGMGNTKFVFTIEPATVAVTGVTLAPTTATLTLGETETVTLIPTVLPDDATDKTVTWTTSNASVATVANGVVTAVAPGTATITATATNGTADTSDDKTATCTVTVAEPTYTVTVKDGTDDATNWQGKAGTGEYQALPLEGVAANTAVTVKYSGAKKVKSVKAVKKAKPAATVTTAPTAKTGVKAGEDVAIVNEGAAEGGTMMYMVNATQPASTDGFSATVPTAEGLTAGTYYVWYYVKADDSHTDSEISALGIEVTIAAAVEPTLANTLNNAGMNVKVNFNYRWGVCYCLFTSNGNGTYTFQSGDEDFGGNLSRSRDLVVEDGKLVFKANWYSPITNYWDTDGYSVTFDTSNSTYNEWVGGDNTDEPSFISVEVNGTTISLSKASKITVDDLVKEEMQSWEDIVSNNSDKIYIDSGNIKRLSDGAKLKYSVGDIWEDVNSWDNYDPNTTYKFAGD